MINLPVPILKVKSLREFHFNFSKLKLRALEIASLYLASLQITDGILEFETKAKMEGVLREVLAQNNIIAQKNQVPSPTKHIEKNVQNSSWIEEFSFEQKICNTSIFIQKNTRRYICLRRFQEMKKT